MIHRRTSRLVTWAPLGSALTVAGLLACSAASSDKGNGEPTGSGATGATQTSGGGPNLGGSGVVLGGNMNAGGQAVPAGDCVNLQCQQTTCTRGNCKEEACAAGAVTTVTGVVSDPAGKVPLYNVVVYVPNQPVQPFTPGVSCDQCGFVVDNPVAAALTDTHGRFVLEDVPVGADIPVVIQIGRWRRQITIPNVPACTETGLTDLDATRLPKNKAEGDIPLIAIVTGGADSLECLPRRMGIEDSEFTTAGGEGRIHLYKGMTDGSDKPAPKFASTHLAGAPLADNGMLVGSLEELKKYDMVLLSCEGGSAEEQKPMAWRQALYDYASAGGRVLATHWQHIWYSGGPAPVPTTGTWLDREDPPETGVVGTINTSFPKGAALAEWLVNVGSMDPPGTVVISDARDNIQAVNPASTTEWLTIQNENEAASPTAVEYLTFNTPIDAAPEEQCGRAVFTDLHVGAASGDTSAAAFPSGCEVQDLSTQEKVVEFMLMDLGSCIQKDDVPPEPPVVVK